MTKPAHEPVGREGTHLVSRTTSRRGDRVFAALTSGAGIAILVSLAAVGLFLVIQAIPALTAPASKFDDRQGFVTYVGPLVFGTVLAAALALLLAVPLAVAVALFLSHYAPRRLARPMSYVIDLLAAIPSVVFGIWGIAVLAPLLAESLFKWLEQYLGFIPLFAGPASTSGRTMLTAALVLAVMILPIITAISREIFAQTPKLYEEASLALGATKWEMIRQSVLPYGRSGVISGAMLGLGRALGETMAVAIILSGSNIYTLDLISNQNSNTIAANIALKFPESSGLEVNRLIATGLVLFIITFIVNAAARRLATRGTR